MEQVSLTECEMAAWEALEIGALGQALAIGAHILEHHPQAGSAHLLLGEALHRSGHVGGAKDYLLRALSADPEASSAYAGLSRIASDEGDLGAAIWHAERAFELAPWDAGDQQWRRRLHARRDGVERRRVSLTRAALARIYMSGGSLWRARSALESLLGEVPQRVDLQGALMEVLWRLEEHQGMALLCERTLEEHPLCWKAHLLLGLQRQREGRSGDADTHLAQAQAVDPDGRRTEHLLGKEAELPWEPASIPGWDGADLPLWEETIAQLQEREKRTALFSPQEVAWVRDGGRELGDEE